MNGLFCWCYDVIQRNNITKQVGGVGGTICNLCVFYINKCIFKKILNLQFNMLANPFLLRFYDNWFRNTIVQLENVYNSNDTARIGSLVVRDSVMPVDCSLDFDCSSLGCANEELVQRRIFNHPLFGNLYINTQHIHSIYYYLRITKVNKYKQTVLFEILLYLLII